MIQERWFAHIRDSAFRARVWERERGEREQAKDNFYRLLLLRPVIEEVNRNDIYDLLSNLNNRNSLNGVISRPPENKLYSYNRCLEFLDELKILLNQEYFDPPRFRSDVNIFPNYLRQIDYSIDEAIKDEMVVVPRLITSIYNSALWSLTWHSTKPKRCLHGFETEDNYKIQMQIIQNNPGEFIFQVPIQPNFVHEMIEEFEVPYVKNILGFRTHRIKRHGEIVKPEPAPIQYLQTDTLNVNALIPLIEKVYIHPVTEVKDIIPSYNAYIPGASFGGCGYGCGYGCH